jgi:propionyl-CoA carboxylase alpha chain
VIDPAWTILDGREEYPVSVTASGEGAYLVAAREADGGTALSRDILVRLNGWTPGARLVEAEIDGTVRAVKVDQTLKGFRLRRAGADLSLACLTPRQAQAFRLMPEKVAADTSKMLLCPMPGLVVSIAVEEGQTVEAGQTLATVEAMKMENVLKAERKGVVKAIVAKAGDSLAVDEMIMEFE